MLETKWCLINYGRSERSEQMDGWIGNCMMGWSLPLPVVWTGELPFWKTGADFIQSCLLPPFLSFISKGWPSNLTLLISRSISRLASITAIVRDCEFTTSLKLWSSENLYLLLNTFKTQLRNIRKRALTSAACLQVHEIEHLINYRGIIISWNEKSRGRSSHSWLILQHSSVTQSFLSFIQSHQ